MEQIDQITLLIGVASFIGAILGAALSNIVSARIAKLDREEARRTERIQRLTGLIDSLIRLRSTIQHLSFRQGTQAESEKAFAESYAVMLSSGNKDILALAKNFMDVDTPKYERIDQAIVILGNKVAEL